MKRYIGNCTGYFEPVDLAAMQREFEAGMHDGESREEAETRAHRIFMKYQTRMLRPSVEELDSMPMAQS